MKLTLENEIFEPKSEKAEVFLDEEDIKNSTPERCQHWLKFLLGKTKKRGIIKSNGQSKAKKTR